MKKDTLAEVLKHYEMVKEDNQIRQTRENGYGQMEELEIELEKILNS